MSVGAWDIAMTGAKAAAYAATLGASGGVFFLAYNRELLVVPDRGAVRRLVRWLMLAAVVASCARIALTAAAMTGEWSGLVDGGLIRMIWQAGAWREMAVRAAGLLLAAPAALGDRRPTPPALVGAMAAASSFAWAGHAHALAASWPTAVAVIHLLGVAFWVGALVPLLLVLRHDDPRRAAAPVVRFGNAALVGVGVLAFAGLALLAALLGKFAYWLSPYGCGVALKLALVAALLACAAWNKLRLTRRLAANDRGALRRLRWSIRTELALAALILIVTACFTTLTGPPSLE